MKSQVFRYILMFGMGTSLFHGASGQTKQMLSPEAFIGQVRQFHPVAKQANLITENAAANLLSARGGFDPVLEMNMDSKSLDGTNYYRYNNPELKIPTPAGAQIKTGFENSNGQYINPELTKGVASYIGVEIPLLNGLLMDKRRAVLQQAKIYRSQSEAERLTVINDLLFEAYSSYWQWTAAYQLYMVYSNYVDIAIRRMRLVKLTFQNGDRALADTVEAYTQLQNYQLLQTAALLDLNNKTIDLSQYLWDGNQNPYLLSENYIPDTSQFSFITPLPNIEELVSQVAFTHPETRTYQYKLKGLDVERRLKFQDLLPVVNMRANILSKDYYSYKGLDAAYLENNYKLGVTIKMPLLLRQGRGEYKKVQLKIKEMDLSLSQKIWSLQNKIRQYHNEARLLQEQIQVALSMYRNYLYLLRTEELKFSQGESSLFLINTRENKALEMQQKIVALRLKYVKSVYAIEWASGVIR